MIAWQRKGLLFRGHYVKPIKQHQPCPECGSVKTVKNGSDERYVRDLPILGKTVELIILNNRYLCRDCKRSYFPVYNSVYPRSRVTKRMEEVLWKESFKGAFSHVGDRYGLSDNAVRDIFIRLTGEIDSMRVIEAPEVLGIDEVHIADKARGVFVNNSKEPTLLELTANNLKDTFVEVFGRFDNPENIKAITMDFWRPYREAIRIALPHATIVGDRFHVVQFFTKAMKQARACLVEEVRKKWKLLSPDVAKEKKRKFAELRVAGYYTYLENFENMDEYEPLAIPLIEAIEQEFPEFAKAYYLKEGFRNIYTQYDREDAEEYFDDLVKSIPPDDAFEGFRKAAKTVNRWRNEIFSWYDYVEPISNGPIEGKNSLIKYINSIGCGYSYEILRAKLLQYDNFGKNCKVVHTRPLKKQVGKGGGYSTQYVASYDTKMPGSDFKDEMTLVWTGVPLWEAMIIADRARREMAIREES